MNENIGYEALETEKKSRMKAGDYSLMLQKERYDLVLIFLVCQDDSSTISSSAAYYNNPFIRSFVFYRQINTLIGFWLAWGISKSEGGLPFLECLIKKTKEFINFPASLLCRNIYCIRFLQVLCVVVALFFNL